MERVRRAALAALAAALLVVLAPQAASAVSVGHSGWNWGSPLPQGNTLRALEFAGARGYAAGEFGTLLRTEDGGATWSGIPTGVTVPLRHIRLIGADSLIVAGACTVRRSDDGGDSFRRLPWTASDQNCTANVASLSFPTSDVGYLLLDNGIVLRSTDGGGSWQRRTAVPGTSATPSGAARPTDIAFLSADTGVAVTDAGAVYRSTDGGGSWVQVATGMPRLEGVHFPTADTGYVVGAAGTVLKTADGGATWTVRPTGLPGAPPDLSRVRCFDAATCVIATERGDQVVRTVDGGETFASVSAATEAVYAVSLASATRAVAVGIGGVTVVSDNAGVTWAELGGRVAGSFRGLEALSSETAFAFGVAGALARTDDGGRTWVNVGASTPNEIRDVSFADPLVGYALDVSGQLLRTSNGGVSWSILNTGTTAAPQAVLAVTADTVLLAGPRGLRRSTDGGQTFSAVRDRRVARAPLDELDPASGGVVFAYDRGGRAVASSANGGRSWRAIRRLPVRAGVREYDWISARTGYALGRDGRLYRTGDGGRRWRWLPATGNTPIHGIAFASARSGYLRVTGPRGAGVLLHTNNGGATFRPQLVQRAPIAAVAAPGGGTEFLLGNTVVNPAPGYSPAHSLMYTTTGGDQGEPATISLRARQTTRRSRGRRARTVTIQVDGRLAPRQGGEQIVVSARPVSGRGMRTVIVTAASNGAFTTTWLIRGRTVFTAQWSGDDDRQGAGSTALTVTPR